MSEHRLPLEPVLLPDERKGLDEFCAGVSGESSLPELAGYLSEHLATELVTDPDIVGGYARDSSNLPGSAVGLARPRSERECAAVLYACHRAAIPVTVSAGRSNLTGSATARGGIVLSMERMSDPPLAVDSETQSAVAPVGIFLEDFRKRVLDDTEGALYFPVDPTSREDAQVGGAIACNASGFTPGEAGAMRPWVQSVEFLFPNGSKLRAKRGQYSSREGEFVLAEGNGTTAFPVPRHPRPQLKNAGGPYSSPEGTMDFVDLVVGSEGIFGVVTACTLGLKPRPKDYLDLFFSLPGEEYAVSLRHRLGERLDDGVGSLSALEYFGPNCRQYMDHQDRLFHGDDPVAVYIQVPLSERTIEDAAEEWLELLSELDCGVDEDAIVLMDNDRDRRVFLEARHSMPANSLEVVQHRGTFTIMTDAVVPEERFPEFLDYAHGLIASKRLDYLAFGHLGDCHLHFMILPEADEVEKGTEVYDCIIARSAELGGVYSGEHGTGKRKRRDFVRCFGREGVEGVRRAKAAVDPGFLLNAGNVID